MIDQHTTGTSEQQEARKPDIDYADGVAPAELMETVTTEAKDLWKENEELFVWIFKTRTNALLRTVPGGGKSYQKETVVPQLAYETGQSFVLATTEYRNRQNTYREVLETMAERNLVDEIDVVYLPSPRELYSDIPQQTRVNGEPGVTTHDDESPVCQTFAEDDDGKFIHSIADDIESYINQGATTGVIHNAALSEWEGITQNEWGQTSQQESASNPSPLPCHREGKKLGYDPLDDNDKPACRYQRWMGQKMEQIEERDPDIVICGASLLNVPAIVQGSTVIADEDVSGELVETYDRDYFESAIESYLTSIDGVPDTHKGVLRSSKEVREEVVQHVRENHAPQAELDSEDDKSPLVNRNAPVKANSIDYDRSEAPLFTLAAFEGNKTEDTDHVVLCSEDLPYTVSIDLSSGYNSTYDEIAIAAPPQPLKKAEQVIALDATGAKNWWDMLTGLSLESLSPNPLDERGKVVTEAFDTEFRQVTQDMVSINRPNSLSAREFLGIVQAVVAHHDSDEVSIVTSKSMRRKVRESEYASEVMELAYKNTILYFGALRSDRTFEESTLHTVIGAPHPGDDAVRQRMALLGIDEKIVQDDHSVRGEDRYKGEAKTTLEDIVHSEIYQASRRAARDADRDGTAYVYLYTRMFDKALIAPNTSYTINIFGAEEKRKGGTEAILASLDSADEPLKTEKVADLANDQIDDDSLSNDRIRQKLSELSESGVVEKSPWVGREKRWEIKSSPRHATLSERNSE